MTDELERLLEEAGEESERVAQSLMFRADYFRTNRKETAAVETAGEETAGRFESGESPFAEKKTERIRMEEDPAASRSVQTMYRTLTRTKQLVRTARQTRENSRTPMAHRSVSEREPAREAIWLDRIFRRDARRYDGGFTWQ